MGFVCVGISKLPCWKASRIGKEKPPPVKTQPQLEEGAVEGGSPVAVRRAITDSKFKPSPVAAQVEKEDSYNIGVVPAAHEMGYRQPGYYRHAIRAGENRMMAHPDKLDAPSLFAIDPEASIRARAKWQLARSGSILPMEALTAEQKERRQTTGVISFMQKSASQKKGLAAVLEKGGSEGGGGGGIAGLATVATIAKPPAEETAVEEFVATDAPSQSEAAPAPAES